MKTGRLITLALAGLAAPLSAQQIAVFPSDHATTEGYSDTVARGSRYPLSEGVARTQLLYEARDLTIPHGGAIQKVGFRQDGSKELPGDNSNPYRIQLEILMCASTKTVEDVNRAFAQNYEGTPLTVLDKTLVDLPIVPKPAQAPSTTYVWIPLTRPFNYDSGKNLLVEYLVYANSIANAPFDYPLDWAQYISTTEQIGTGCKSSGNVEPVASTSKAYPGGSWSLSLSKAPANAGAVVTVGISKTHLFGAIPLPLDLAFAGAPGCMIHSSIEVMFPFTANSSGAATIRFTLPADVGLNDQTLYCQFIVVDPFANKLGLITSNSAATTFGMQPRVAKVYLRNSTTGANGTVDASQSYGQILSAFEYK